MESVTIVTEPLLHRDFVQFEIVVPILERLSAKYDVTLAAPKIAPGVRDELERRGIHAADGGAHFPPIRRSRDEIPSYIGSWTRDALWGMNRRDIERALVGTDGIRINLSMSTAIDADVWLIQSRPQSLAFDELRRGVSFPLRVGLTCASPFVGRLDVHHLLDAGRRARERYTTTQHVADWFSSKGLPVAGVMPMYYRTTIRRTTTRPSRDFILVYVGKETDSTALRMLLETGLPVTMFGTKSAGWVLKALQLHRYPHARLLGHVSDDRLSDLYSNARFTAFPFTEEPFGLVPLESMACGTPVLTYGVQGPGESVLDGRTGWLVHTAEEFTRRAVELWNGGVPSSLMVDRCLERARTYHLDTVHAGWIRLIDAALERSWESPLTARPREWVRPEPSLGVGSLPPAGAVAMASVRGPSFAPLEPAARPALATVPAPKPRPALSEPPSPFSRSGGYYDVVGPEPKEVATEDESGDGSMTDSLDPDSSDRSVTPDPLRRVATEGASPSLL